MKRSQLKKGISIVLAASLCLGLSACGGGGDGAATGTDSPGGAPSGEKIVIKMNTSWGENSSVQEGALKFGELLSEASGGRFEVKVYPSNQLASGNQQTAIEMLQNGDIEASLMGMTILSSVDDRLAVVNMPFLITSYEEADALIYDESAKSRQLLDQVLDEKGMVSVAFGEAGFRQITNNKREVRTPADMKDLKFRVLSTCPMFFDLYGALDANPTAMNMGEVFTSLQQGVIDGEENAVDTIKSYKINEVQKYITCWNGVYDAVSFTVSPKFWDSLSEEDQKLVKDSAAKAMEYQRQVNRDSVDGILEEFGKTMTVTELTEEETKAFKDAANPVYDTWYDKIGEEMMTAFGYTK